MHMISGSCFIHAACDKQGELQVKRIKVLIIENEANLLVLIKLAGVQCDIRWCNLDYQSEKLYSKLAKPFSDIPDVPCELLLQEIK